MICIYQILNLINEKFYIGSAYNDTKRWKEHKYHLARHTHKNLHLQASWNLHGEEAFEFIVIEVCEKETLLEREQYWIDSLKPEYNIALIAGSRAGVLMPQSAKDKIGKNSKRHMTGRALPEKTRLAISLANKGKQFTKGRKQPPEEIARRVAANTGKKRTQETKQKMSEARKGIIFSDEHKLNQSLAAKRRWEIKRAAK